MFHTLLHVRYRLKVEAGGPLVLGVQCQYGHWDGAGWLLILFLMVCFRQYYMYATDSRCKRVGTQCWVYGAIMATEALLCIKNGKDLFGHTQATNICIWLLLIFLLSCLCVYGCVVWHKYFQVGKLHWRCFYRTLTRILLSCMVFSVCC